MTKVWGEIKAVIVFTLTASQADRQPDRVPVIDTKTPWNISALRE